MVLEKCVVYIDEPLNIKGLTNPKLIVYSNIDTSSNICPTDAQDCKTYPRPPSPSTFEVVDSITRKVLNDSEPFGVTYIGRIYQIVGCIVAGTNNSQASSDTCTTITNYSAFKASSNYKKLINVLDSISFN